MSILFLFGAGASHGSLDCRPECPPIGARLFDQLKKHAVITGHITATIGGNLADIFRENFEEGMRKFGVNNINKIQMSSFMTGMALYFLQFEPQGSNLYFELAKLIKKSDHKVVVSTINYDLLIESAFEMACLSTFYPLISPYSADIPLYKLHGSCNFFLDRIEIKGIKIISYNVNGTVIDADIKSLSKDEAIKWCMTNDTLAPAMSLYTLGKPIPFGARRIRWQQAAWASEVLAASHVIVVGVAVNQQDTHIWGPLSAAKAQITYIAKGEQQAFEKWAHDNCHGKRAQYLCDDFEDAFLFIKDSLLSI